MGKISQSGLEVFKCHALCPELSHIIDGDREMLNLRFRVMALKD